MQPAVDPELLARYVEDRVSAGERRQIESMMQDDPRLRELVQLQWEVSAEQKIEGLAPVPEAVTRRARELAAGPGEAFGLDILVQFARDAFERVSSTAEVILGPGLGAQPVLRGEAPPARTAIIRKEMGNTCVTVYIDRGRQERNTIAVQIKTGPGEDQAEGLRMILIEDEDELESYVPDEGKSVFEDIPPGTYSIEILRASRLLGTILLRIQKKA